MTLIIDCYWVGAGPNFNPRFPQLLQILQGGDFGRALSGVGEDGTSWKPGCI